MTYKKQHKCIVCKNKFVARNWRAEVCSHKCHLARKRAWVRRNRDRINFIKRSRWDEEKRKKGRAYEKTPKGFLMRMFRNMQSRVRGIQKGKFHLYREVEIEFTREEFYKWALENPKFWELRNQWEKSGHDRKYTPTVDRIDSKGNYSFENIEWVTHSENSRRGALSRHRQQKI